MTDARAIEVEAVRGRLEEIGGGYEGLSVLVAFVKGMQPGAGT
jgi:hypothetical protein